MLAYDHFMFNADFEPIRQVDWLLVVAKLVEKCDEDDIRALLVRIFRFLDTCNLVECQEQVPLLLLNSIMKVGSAFNLPHCIFYVLGFRICSPGKNNLGFESCQKLLRVGRFKIFADS
jgi:hypothetical protein